MQTIEFFSGTGSFSKVAKKLGHRIFRIDNNEIFETELLFDLNNLTILNKIPLNVSVAWFSPPCTYFSVSSIGRHWNKDHTPKSKQALEGLEMLETTIYYISELLKRNPKTIWYLENPVGKMRKVIEPIFKKYGIEFVQHTVTYCQYGDNRQKPTDIWTNNFLWISKPICKRGASCHQSAPRGSRTGTQGMKNSIEKGRIPSELFYEILDPGSRKNKKEKTFSTN